MPNGRSGCLFLNKAEFAGWLSGFVANEIIGLCLPSPKVGRLREVSVETVVGMLATYPGDRIAVEEQDGDEYIIHLDYPLGVEPSDFERWILVRPKSPLFQELRRQHNQQGRWGAGFL